MNQPQGHIDNPFFIDFQFENLPTVAQQPQSGITYWNTRIVALRNLIIEKRLAKNNKLYVKVLFPAGVKLFQNGDKFTYEGFDEMRYQLDVKNLYPVTQMVKKSKNSNELKPLLGMIKQIPIFLEEIYNGQLTVSNFLGIMIAEQLRFSTLQFFSQNGLNNQPNNREIYGLQDMDLDSKELFEYFDQFRTGLYTGNWNGPIGRILQTTPKGHEPVNIVILLDNQTGKW